jgi:hypothetical protein
VRRLRAIVDSARPQVSQLVSKVVTTTFDRPISTDDLRGWREQVNSHVAREAGFAYQAYVRLKLASVRAFGAELIVKLRGVPAQSPLSRVVAEIIDAWALRKGIVYERADSEALEFETQTADHLPAWVKYLLAFDVKYRERRLHFLIKGQNRLYQLIGSSASSTAASMGCAGGRMPTFIAARCATWRPIFFRLRRRPRRSSISRVTRPASWNTTSTRSTG